MMDFQLDRRGFDSAPGHQCYDIPRFSTTLYDAAPAQERNAVRQLISFSTLRWRSLVTWRGLHSQNEQYGTTASAQSGRSCSSIPALPFTTVLGIQQRCLQHGWLWKGRRRPFPTLAASSFSATILMMRISWASRARLGTMPAAGTAAALLSKNRQVVPLIGSRAS
jgi:hypothetical protein